MGKRKVTGLVKLKNKIYLWRKGGKKKGDTIILTIRESRTSQEEQQEMVNAVCRNGFTFISIWERNVRFEKPGEGKDIKEIYGEICEILKEL